MTLTVRSASVTGATTAGRALTHPEMDANWAHVIQSSNLSFTQSGSGAIARTTQAKLQEVVSAKDFGAVGNWNGSTGTDDTAAIQAALDTNAPAVWLPPGGYKITSSLIQREDQVIFGVPFSGMTHNAASYRQSCIVFRPTGLAKVAIRNDTSKNGQGLRDIAIDLNDATHTGVQYLLSYANHIDGLMFFGTFNIGIYLDQTHECDLSRILMQGCYIKKFGIYAGLMNGLSIRNFHTSCLPSDNSVTLYGVGAYSVSNLTVDDYICQGLTIGLAMDFVSSAVISNMYNENTLCNVRIGTADAGSGTVMILGGTFFAPYATHPQYSHRGPVIFARGGFSHSIRGARFRDVGAPANANGPWNILIGEQIRDLLLDSCLTTGVGSMKDLLNTDVAGRTCGIAIMNDRYVTDTYFAREIVLKCDGSYGGNCYRIGVNNAGALTTTAWAPTAISGTVDALLTADLPLPASLVV